MECIKNKCKYYQDHLFNASCFECSLGSRTYKKEYVIDCIIDEKIECLLYAAHTMQKQRDFIAKINVDTRPQAPMTKCVRCGVYVVGGSDDICDDCKRERNGY